MNLRLLLPWWRRRDRRVARLGGRPLTAKSMLVDLGIAADRITTRGVGSDGPGHIPDVDAHGVLLPGPAARNRAVVVELSCERR
jgi:OOP family OmpA-OmpF porin